ncbi:MAG: single-stranded DNA-binding protein [Nocardioidaceae bacterium]
MGGRTTTATDAVTTGVNEVVLAGRVSAEPEERVLPSGDTVWSFRVVVDRVPDRRRPQAPRVDTLDCAVWTGPARRTVQRLGAGDLVEVRGALRRRFFRASDGGAASRVEVEVRQARVIRRAASA